MTDVEVRDKYYSILEYCKGDVVVSSSIGYYTESQPSIVLSASAE